MNTARETVRTEGKKMRILANDFVGEFALNYWKEEKTLVISFSQKINSIQRKTQKVSKPHNEFI